MGGRLRERMVKKRDKKWCGHKNKRASKRYIDIQKKNMVSPQLIEAEKLYWQY